MRGSGASSASTRVVPVKLRGIRARLLEAWAAAWLGVKIYFRYPAWIVADIVTTPIWLIVFILPILLFLPRDMWGNPETLNFFFWAMVMWGIVSSGFWSFGNTIRWEQEAGTIEQLFLTNASRAVVFARRIFSNLITITIDTAYTAVVFTLLFEVPLYFRNPLGVAAALLVGLLSAAGFGLTYGALVLRFKNVGPLNNVLQFIILGLCGIFVPITVLPEPLRAVAMALPYTYVADLVRHEAMGAPTLLPAPLEWGVTLALTAVFLAVGVYMLRRVEENLKRRGELATY